MKEVDDPRRFGVVELNDDGSIRRMLEKPDKPPTNKAIVGVYKMSDPALLFAGLDHVIENNVTTKGEIQLTDALEWMVQKGHRMLPFEIDEWLDCGKPETLFETNRRLLEDLPAAHQAELQKRFPQAVIVPPVVIGEGCKIEESVVGPYAVLGANCQVTRAMVRDSIVGEGATVHRIMLKDSLIGDNAEVEGTGHSLNIGDSSAIQMGRS